MTSTGLGNQGFKTCSWIPLAMVQSLLLNSALLEKRIPALAFKFSYASPVLNKIWNPLTVCGIRLHFAEYKQIAIFSCCGIRDTTNVPKKFTLHSYVPGIHGSFVCGTPLHFGTCLKISFWNPATYRHKIVRLSSAQFGLVMCPLNRKARGFGKNKS